MYQSESRQWLKCKCVNGQKLVIAGYTDPQGERIGFGVLLVGCYERGKLRYAGKVGTGYDHQALRRLAKHLAGLETGSSPFDGRDLRESGVYWAKPKQWPR